MRRALETPKKAEIHDSMDFVINEDSLLRALAKTSSIKQMDIRFPSFAGSKFAGMPREGVAYYPVLALVLLGRGQCYKTFDDYLLSSGTTALIYPVERQHKSSIRRILLAQAIPACNSWLETFEADHNKSEAYYVMHDHTFGELVFGPHDISRAAFNWQGSFLKKARSVVGLERHIPQPG